MSNRPGTRLESGNWDYRQVAGASSILEKYASDGLIAIDARGCISDFNRGAELLLGYPRQEVIGQPITYVLRLHDSALPEGQFPPIGSAGLYELLDREDQPIQLYLSHALQVPEAALPCKSILLLRRASDLEATDNLKLRLLANISQEFRTPLAAIKASVEFFQEELELLSPTEIDALLDSIHLSVSGLEAMIDNILESLNIEADHFKLHFQVVDLTTVIHAAIQATKPLLSRRQQQLHLCVRDPLQQLRADPNRLEQAIVNLLSNASKFSPIGQPIDLEVSSEKGRYLRVSISDRGVGIPSEGRMELFRPFGRVRKTDEPPHGIGLGLSIVKAIVEGHGGEVGIADREGGGSVIWFNLPYNNP